MEEEGKGERERRERERQRVENRWVWIDTSINYLALCFLNGAIDGA